MRLVNYTKTIRHGRGRPTRYANFMCPHCWKTVEMTISLGNKRRSCGCIANGRPKFDSMENIRFDGTVHYLGRLCGHNHEYYNTGKSIRYIKHDVCVLCNSLANTGHTLNKRPGLKQDRTMAVLDCKKYRECLRNAALNDKTLRCDKCPYPELVKGAFREELSEAACSNDYNEFTEHPDYAGGYYRHE